MGVGAEVEGEMLPIQTPNTFMDLWGKDVVENFYKVRVLVKPIACGQRTGWEEPMITYLATFLFVLRSKKISQGLLALEVTLKLVCFYSSLTVLERGN